jgi:hypothetical protein
LYFSDDKTTAEYIPQGAGAWVLPMQLGSNNKITSIALKPD